MIPVAITAPINITVDPMICINWYDSPRNMIEKNVPKNGTVNKTCKTRVRLELLSYKNHINIGNFTTTISSGCEQDYEVIKISEINISTDKIYEIVTPTDTVKILQFYNSRIPKLIRRII